MIRKLYGQGYGCLITMVGLPGSGKSSITRELSCKYQLPCFCEPEENMWPDCVLKRDLSGFFGGLMWFRSLRVCQLYQAKRLRDQKNTVFLDTYFDKLFLHCLGKQGVEWLIDKKDPYFEIMMQIAQKDDQLLPDVDCIVFFDLDYETWLQLLNTRKRGLESNWFNKEFFRLHHYLQEAALVYAQKMGIKYLVFKQSFSTPGVAAIQLGHLLEGNGILMREHL